MANIKGLYKRGNVYWLNVQKNGRRQFISLHTSDLATAVRVAAEHKINATVATGDRLSDAAIAFLADKKATGTYSRKSGDWSESALKLFIDYVGNVKPASVTPKAIEDWNLTLRKRISPSSAQSYIRAVSSFFSWLHRKGEVTTNPVKNLRLPKVAKVGKVDFCTAATRDALIAGCTDEALRFVLFCGFHAGLRKNEIIEARPDWFDLTTGLVRVQNTTTFSVKDRDSRTIPMTRAFLAFIQEYGLRSPYMLMPDVKHGRSVYRYDFRLPFTRYVTLAGHPEVTTHSMRRTFASLLVSAGVSVYKVAKWLGDSVDVTERHYGHLRAQDEDIERSHG